jgi:uncharacterized protein YneF (UPF0154 family)
MKSNFKKILALFLVIFLFIGCSLSNKTAKKNTLKKAPITQIKIKPIVKKTKKKIEKKEPMDGKYSLTINTIPKNARVRIMNIIPKYHDKIRLKKGKYNIRVDKEDYFVKDFEIYLKSDLNMNLILDKKNGSSEDIIMFESLNKYK